MLIFQINIGFVEPFKTQRNLGSSLKKQIYAQTNLAVLVTLLVLKRFA